MSVLDVFRLCLICMKKGRLKSRNAFQTTFFTAGIIVL